MFSSLRLLVPGLVRATSIVGSGPLNQQVTRSMANHRHKKIIRLAKGYRGRTNCYSIALRRVEKALQYAYVGRKVWHLSLHWSYVDDVASQLKKRDMRSLWITRINAGCRMYDLRYNRLIHVLARTNVTLNRKVRMFCLTFHGIVDLQSVGSCRSRQH